VGLTQEITVITLPYRARVLEGPPAIEKLAMPTDKFTPEHMAALVAEAHLKYKDTADGEVSKVYPALARVKPELFGVCAVGWDGKVYAAGDTEVEFTIMSVAKPFTFALVCEAIGPHEARRKIGVGATGLAFNSAAAIEVSMDGRTNPMVNSGAIATVSLMPGKTTPEKWAAMLAGYSRFAGRELKLNEEVYDSASKTNSRNRSLAFFLESRNCIYSDPLEALDLYTRQSSVNVTAKDLAVMGATLANGGLNPVTGKRVVATTVCHYVLAVMATAGLYEGSGEWLYDVGVPGKSGISGGILAASPGRGGLGTFGPRLDKDGNSVQGILAAKYLADRMGMDLFSPDRK
jgi:glutaminase